MDTTHSPDDEAAIAVADAIRQSGGIKPETPSTAEELAELEERRERFRHYWHRQSEEQRRVEDAERIAAQRQAEEAERRRIAAVREAARQSAAEHAQKMRVASEERQRNAAIAQQQQEWAAFKVGLQQVQAEKQRQAWLDNQSRLISELENQINPPPTPSGPEVVYVSESEDDWGTCQLGSPNFNPKKRRF